MSSKFSPERSPPQVGHGRACACFSAFSRVFSIHSGSSFCAEISRTTSSSSPLRDLKRYFSSSRKPYLYSSSPSWATLSFRGMG